MTKRPAPTTCPCCGMRYWLEVRVMEEPPAVDVADVRGIWPAVDDGEASEDGVDAQWKGPEA